MITNFQSILICCLLCQPLFAEGELKTFGHEDSSATKFVILLSHPDLRAALGVDETGYQSLIDATADARSSIPSVEELSALNLADQINLLDDKFSVSVDQDDKIWSLLEELLPPDKLEKLIGLYLHRHGAEGILNPRIRGMLRVTEKQLERLRVATDSVKKERTRVFNNLSDVASMKQQDLLLLAPDDLASWKAVIEILSEDQRNYVERCLAGWKPKIVRFF